MEGPPSMANHIQKNLGHTLSQVSTVSIGKDRFQDVYRQKARYRFWGLVSVVQGTCKLLMFVETCVPTVLHSTGALSAVRGPGAAWSAGSP